MSGETLLRQWALLQAIPSHSYKTASQLHENLRSEGFDVQKRTIERDLMKLRDTFPLLLNDKSVPYGWRWDPTCRLLDIPGMDPATALTFKLAESYLTPLLPRSTLQALERHFGRAEEVLSSARSPLKRWVDKVKIIPRGQRLQAPPLVPEALAGIYQALLQECRFNARYQNRGGEQKEYTVNPLGLVVRDQVSYLVATLRDYQDIRQLALHRFESVELLDEPVTPPAGFDLETYIRAHHFDYPEGEALALELKMRRGTADHLLESPLNDDQQWQELDDGWVRIAATVADTQQLRWWLLGFGKHIEVLGPPGLREEFADIAASLADRYLATPQE